MHVVYLFYFSPHHYLQLFLISWPVVLTVNLLSLLPLIILSPDGELFLRFCVAYNLLGEGYQITLFEGMVQMKEATE